MTTGIIPTARRLLNLGRHSLRFNRSGSSFAGEYEHMAAIAKTLRLENGYVVDIAASDGVSQSCTLEFFKRPGWRGLAVEMDPHLFTKLAFSYATLPDVCLARGRVTPRNVVAILDGFEVPRDFSILNLDIDSYDLHVMEAMLSAGYRPAMISMEINEKIPPSIYFTVDYDPDHYWQRDHFYGCSLAAAAQTVRPHGYVLEWVEYNNVTFIRADLAAGLFPDVSPDLAYRRGYVDRPDRLALFPWNADMDVLLSISPAAGIEHLRQAFARYEGRFTLRPAVADDQP